MATTEMSVKKARKILGRIADGLSDQELKNEIRVAELLKLIFFGYITKK